MEKVVKNPTKPLQKRPSQHGSQHSQSNNKQAPQPQQQQMNENSSTNQNTQNQSQQQQQSTGRRHGHKNHDGQHHTHRHHHNHNHSHHHHYHHRMQMIRQYPLSYYTLNSLYSKPNFLREFADVRETEQGLNKLLTDFHEGRINAFGENITLENMIKVREQQENLARLHFEMNQQQSNQPSSPIIQSYHTPGSIMDQSKKDRNKESDRYDNNKIKINDSNNNNSEDSNNSKQVQSKPKQSSTSDSDHGKSSSPSTSPSLSPTSNTLMLMYNHDSMNVGSKPFSKSNMIKLIQNLQNLCESIELLQSKNKNSIDQ